MKIVDAGAFFVGHLDARSIPEKDCSKLMSLANEEFADELADMIDESLPLADPVVLFGVSPVDTNNGQVLVNGITIPSDLAFEKLSNKKRCFPYI